MAIAKSHLMRDRMGLAHRTKKHQRARLRGGTCRKPRHARRRNSVRDCAATSCDCSAKRRDLIDGTVIAHHSY
ncbi:hypothetical protein AB7M49_006586 [Bradyrhizobium elkanii]|uniref:hypothetical protein n=1 Tax=Bradyrhizobium elkanii TaxID=29448 RepID=UPI00114D3443|nr:hypothetical protein [Bradyrhizobium elkanii]